MMVYWSLFWEFFKTGLFAVGGGLATLPFLYEMAEKFDWFTSDELVNMIAISESTPGPIGINMATYAGFLAAGVLGSLIASFSVAIPGAGISILVARGYGEFHNNRFVKYAFYAIRPVVAALIAQAAYGIIKVALFNFDAYAAVGFWGVFRWVNIAIFAVLMFLTNRFKKIHPIVFLAAAAVLGVMLKL